MKKALIILAVVLFVSCSKDENKSQATLTYGITTQQNCPVGIPVSSQVSKSTYDYINATYSIPSGSGCNWVSVKDINENTISGYLISWGSPYSK